MAPQGTSEGGRQSSDRSLYDGGLPPAYDQGVFDEKVERTYQWVYEKYPGGADYSVTSN